MNEKLLALTAKYPASRAASFVDRKSVFEKQLFVGSSLEKFRVYLNCKMLGHVRKSFLS